MMENKSKMTFGCAYEAPDVQVTEVLVEQGFQGSLEATNTIDDLQWGGDYNEFE